MKYLLLLASLFWSGNLLASDISKPPTVGGTVANGTPGSLLFLDTASILAQDNANLFWDNTNNRLGIGTATPGHKFHILNPDNVQGIRVDQQGDGSGLEVNHTGDGDGISVYLNDITNAGYALFAGTAGDGVGGYLEMDGDGAALQLFTSGGVAKHLVFENNLNQEISISPNASGVTPYDMTLPDAQGGSGTAMVNNGSGALSWTPILTNPMDSAGDLIVGGASGVPTKLDSGTATQVLHGSTTPSWAAVSLTADVSGVLPIANGGSNKALTLAAGGLVWTDADSFEVSTPASAVSQWALSGTSGTGAPTFSNTTTTGKVIDTTVDSVELTITGVASQTANHLLVEQGGGTDLLYVTDTDGTYTRGTTTGAARPTGFIGDTFGCAAVVSSPVALGDNAITDVASGGDCQNVPAGIYLVSACAYYDLGATTTASTFAYAISNTSVTLPTSDAIAVPTGNEIRMENINQTFPVNSEATDCTAPYLISLTNSTTDFFLVVRINYSTAGDANAAGSITFVRIQ